MENQDQQATPPGETVKTTLLITAGLARMRSLLNPGEPEEEFDALVQGWLTEYDSFRSEAFDHQILKVIETDWLHHRALLSILRAEHKLAWAERDREPRERLEEISAFIRRMQRRHAAYERIFQSAWKAAEAYRKSRIAESLTSARLVCARYMARRDYVKLQLLVSDRFGENANSVWQGLEHTMGSSSLTSPATTSDPCRA